MVRWQGLRNATGDGNDFHLPLKRYAIAGCHDDGGARFTNTAGIRHFHPNDLAELNGLHGRLVASERLRFVSLEPTLRWRRGFHQAIPISLTRQALSCLSGKKLLQ